MARDSRPIQLDRRTSRYGCFRGKGNVGRAGDGATMNDIAVYPYVGLI